MTLTRWKMTPIEISPVILLFLESMEYFSGGLCLTPESGRMAHPLDRRNDGPIYGQRTGKKTTSLSDSAIFSLSSGVYHGSKTAKWSAWQMKTRRKSPNVRRPSKADVRESFWESANVEKDTLRNSSEPIFKCCGGMVGYERCAPFKPLPALVVCDPGGAYFEGVEEEGDIRAGVELQANGRFRVR